MCHRCQNNYTNRWIGNVSRVLSSVKILNKSRGHRGLPDWTKRASWTCPDVERRFWKNEIPNLIRHSVFRVPARSYRIYVKLSMVLDYSHFFSNPDSPKVDAFSRRATTVCCFFKPRRLRRDVVVFLHALWSPHLLSCLGRPLFSVSLGRFTYRVIGDNGGHPLYFVVFFLSFYSSLVLVLSVLRGTRFRLVYFHFCRLNTPSSRLWQ